ncbi:hypothetical protein ANANG_G00286440 [Anguilla anguilla]|uniref:Histone chaperone domain-containing protein n=1 Tax=Anguilla anguilla TaxID=7936 RepID=A0A9D3LKL5_ANGAN|nr:hypothetical protein ANANG_G00286440 [Anguilla anguilla]
MKRIVEEELLNMQDSDDEPLIRKISPPSSNGNKRKRGVEDEDEENEGRSLDELARRKKSRLQTSPPDSPDSGIERVGQEDNLKEGDVGEEDRSEGREDLERGEDEKKTSQKMAAKHRGRGQGPSGRKRSKVMSESKEEPESHPKAGLRERRRDEGTKTRARPTWEPGRRGREKNGGENGGRREAADSSSEEEKSEGEETTKEKKKSEAGSDSDSSSLPSLEDEEERKTKSVQEKKIKGKTKEGKGASKDGKEEENKAVSRLKHYIALCGARRNYKKLLEGCRSVKSKVAVLKKELEDLGVTGQPSIEKCKKARLKREEAQELAGLDVSNIISTQGRPKRRGASVWPPPRPVSPPPSSYKHKVSSESDSDEDDSRNGSGGTRPDWSKLKGIISDDADSD